MQNIESQYTKRLVFDEVASHLEKPEITLITGSRQVGKTVLLEQLQKYLIEKLHISPDLIFFYNIDLIKDWEVFQNQSQFIEFLKDRSQLQKIYVFVDEAQKVPEAARFFKGVYDSKLNAKLILTGSSSLEIKAKFKETLAGRKRIFTLSPFTFFEFLTIKDHLLAEYIEEKKQITQIDINKLIELYKEYVTFGGYPRVVLSSSKGEKMNILQEIYSSYIEDDVIRFLGIENKTAFHRLVKLLANQIGQLVNLEELATNLGIDRATVERYIWALEQTFIVKKITPYFRNSRQEIIKAGKIYFLDQGIRNTALENFNTLEDRGDKGSILENSTFQELLFQYRNKMVQIHFWRTKQKAEVDFVIEQGLKLLPIEVKFLLKKQAVPPSLKSFIEKFNPNNALVINLSLHNNQIKINETKLNFIYPFEIDRFIDSISI